MADSDLPDAADGFEQTAPIAPPPLIFSDASGRKLSLTDYKGHVLVVNLWATWCGPCVDELPTFAALAVKIRPFAGLILPISIDIEGAQAVRPFFALHGIADLPILLDPDGRDLGRLDTEGVPTTLIIDPAGRQVGRLDGAANWNTPRILALLQSLAETESKTMPPHVTPL